MKKKLTSLFLALVLCLGLVQLPTITPPARAALTGDGNFVPSNLHDTRNNAYAQRWEECIPKVSWATGLGLTPWEQGTKTDMSTMTGVGSGTVNDPYLVNTGAELRWCLENQKSCKLMSDIDLGGAYGQNWNGITLNTAIVIDGNGHTIYNLYSSRNDGPGFIYYSTKKDAVIKNLTISCAMINTLAYASCPGGGVVVGKFWGGICIQLLRGECARLAAVQR